MPKSSRLTVCIYHPSFTITETISTVFPSMFSEGSLPLDISAIEAMSAIQSVETQYDTFRHEFKFPNQLDFVYQGATISIDVPAKLLDRDVILNDFRTAPVSHQLAYSKNNAQLHSYADTLIHLLVTIDAVEIGGIDKVRNERRSLAEKIDNEAKHLDQHVAEVWETRIRALEQVVIDASCIILIFLLFAGI